MVFHNCRNFLEKSWKLWVCDSYPVSFTIVTNFQSTIATNTDSSCKLIVEHCNICDCLVDDSTDIFLDVDSKLYSWIEWEEYQRVYPSRLMGAVSGECLTQMWSLFQLHSLLSPSPSIKSMEKNKTAACY